MIDFHLVKQLDAFTLDVAHTTDSPFLILMGPSGSGKTTLLNLISGLTTPDRGYLRLNGRLLYDHDSGVSLPPRDRRIGYIFQSLALFPHMTVHQNVMFGVRHRHRNELHSQIRERVAKSDHRQNIHEQLDFLKIAHLSSKYPAELSGGERQRVAIARALSSEADILLMDEPFASLDRANRDNAIQLLLSVQTHYQKAMILVTHSPEEADAFPGDHLEILSGKTVSLKRRISFLDESVNS